MKAVIIGASVTNFGELWKMSLRDMARSVAISAIRDANCQVKDMDAIFVANMLGSRGSGQSHLGSLVANELGINVDSSHIEAACASGGIALLRAVDAVKSGRYKKVLVVGAEKMTDLPTEEVTSALMEAGDEEWEGSVGATFAGLYALLAKSYLEKYKAEREDLALVAVKNHYHASLNPNAHFKNVITVEDVVNSACVASPLTLLDCSPVSDGAAAVVIANSDFSKSQRQIALLGSGVGTDTLSLAERSSFTSLPATKRASTLAYKEANLTAKDINLAEVHDCFTIAEILAMEDLGFYKPGTAFLALRKKETTLGGKLPINLSGGLKGCGHPVGATGVKQVVEIFKQLLGEAGARQTKNAKIGLTQNVGGSGATSVVHIFGK